MEYRGYTGSAEYSGTDRLWYGRVQGISALISYEGADRKALESDFRGAVDDYLKLCKDRGEIPES